MTGQSTPRRRTGLSATPGTRSGAAPDESRDADSVEPGHAPQAAESIPQPRRRAGLTATPRPEATDAPAPPAQQEPDAPPPGRRRRALAWAGFAVGAVVLAAAVIVFARWLRELEGVHAFLVRYPGEYALPAEAPTGLPGWLGWQHFFNVFLMVMIVRSGLLVRYRKRPTLSFTRTVGPRAGSARKVSLDVWLHVVLDVLWIVNGLVYVVLLFATGQWVRIVPTSWEVFPHALSAALQYASMNWPTENGWVNYNSLQQLAYFVTVFIAAPLAVATGARMSNGWPKDAWINRVYPVEWARAAHFPVMLYFVLFTVVHVVLILTTGALRNLNHIFTSRDTVDGWGIALFALSLLAIAAAVAASRPLLLAPVASTMGKVGR